MIIGALGSVFGIVQGLLASEKDMLKVPWGEFSNADGSVTHVYAQWYQGSAVRLRWTFGGNERDAYIRKMAGQITNSVEDIRTIRKRVPQLPPIGLGGRGGDDVPAAPALPWNYLGDKKLSVPLPRSVELIARARALTAEKHFTTPPPLTRESCPTHVQDGIDYARDQIEYNLSVRQGIAEKLDYGTYARERANTAIMYVGGLLGIWAGGSPVPIKAALSMVATIVAIEADLIRHIPWFELAQEYGDCTRQIEEAADMLRYIESNYPECSAD